MVLKDGFWRDQEREYDECRQIQKALDIAYVAHKDEWRKGSGLPYISHIFDIMKMAHKVNIPMTDVITYQAIILHDAVESGYSLDVIKFELPDVAPIVEELTFLGGDKPAYLASFATKSTTALMVKVLDRICNVWDFYDTDLMYARKYLEKADVLFQALLARNPDIVTKWGWSTWNRLIDEHTDLEDNLYGAKS